jgi:hypothetical protein
VVPANADFELQVVILTVQLETRGNLADFTITAEIDAHWALRNVQEDRVVFQQVVQTFFTADRGNGFSRTRLATEGAASANVKEGLRKLGMLEPATLALLR